MILVCYGQVNPVEEVRRVVGLLRCHLRLGTNTSQTEAESNTDTVCILELGMLQMLKRRSGMASSHLSSAVQGRGDRCRW